MTTQQYADYEARVAHYLDGLEFVSTGACPGCQECGLGHVSGIHDEAEMSQRDYDLANEPHFSWSPCEICDSPLGGDRHPWHARTKDGKLVHGTCCSDCMYYLNFGKLDDTTMMEMEEA